MREAADGVRRQAGRAATPERWHDGRRRRRPGDRRRAGRCGRSSSGPAAASPTSAACTRRTPQMALRNARDVYTRRRRASRSGSCRPPRSPRPARTRRTRSSTRPADKVYRHPTFYDVPEGVRAPVTTSTTLASTPTSLGLGDDALVLAQRLGEWISRRAAARGGRRAGQHRARPARPGAHRCSATPASSRAPGRDEDDLAYLRDEREFRNVQLVELPNGDFAVTMARQLVFSTYQYELYTALLTSADATLAGVAGRPSRRSTTTATTPPSGCCGSATAPTSRTAGCRPRSTPSGRTSTSCSTPRRRPPRSPRRHRRRPGRAARPRLDRYVEHGARRGDADRPDVDAGAPGGGRRGHAHRAPGLPARRDAAPAPLAPGGDMVTRPSHRRAADGRARWDAARPRCSTRRSRC